MDFDAYLKRINYQGSLKPELDVLAALQQTHLLNIPFENLDIHRGVSIVLDIEKIYNKVILRKRGGFCYELNELFFQLLKSIGFKVRRIAARVYKTNKGYGQEYDHLALLAEIDGQEYLTDVGFGEFAFQPLLFELGKEQIDPRGLFVIEQHDQEYYRVSKKVDGKWIPEHIFKNIERSFSEFEGMCHYQQHNLASHFRQKRLITIPTLDGRITLTDNLLKIKKGTILTEKEIKEESYNDLLVAYFNFDGPL